MAGTIDVLQRIYFGLEISEDGISFDPAPNTALGPAASASPVGSAHLFWFRQARRSVCLRCHFNVRNGVDWRLVSLGVARGPSGVGQTALKVLA